MAKPQVTAPGSATSLSRRSFIRTATAATAAASAASDGQSQTVGLASKNIVELVDLSNETTGTFLETFLKTTRGDLVLEAKNQNWPKFVHALNISDWNSAAQLLPLVMSQSLIAQLGHDPILGPLISALDWIRTATPQLDQRRQQDPNLAQRYEKWWWFGWCPRYSLITQVMMQAGPEQVVRLLSTIGRLDFAAVDADRIHSASAEMVAQRWRETESCFEHLDATNNLHRPPAWLDNGTPSGAPLWIGPQHYQAYLAWMRLLKKGQLQRRGAQKTKLVHWDAHHDLAARLEGHLFRQWQALRNKGTIDLPAIALFGPRFDIDGFIVPALQEGLFDEYIWVLPDEVHNGPQRSYGIKHARVGITQRRIIAVDRDGQPQHITDACHQLQFDAAEPFEASAVRELTIRLVRPEEVAADPQEALALADDDVIVEDLDPDFLGTYRGPKTDDPRLPDYQLSGQRFDELVNALRSFHQKIKHRVVGGYVPRSPNYTRLMRPSVQAVLRSVLDLSKPQPRWVAAEFDDSLVPQPSTTASHAVRRKRRFYFPGWFGALVALIAVIAVWLRRRQRRPEKVQRS